MLSLILCFSNLPGGITSVSKFVKLTPLKRILMPFKALLVSAFSINISVEDTSAPNVLVGSALSVAPLRIKYVVSPWPTPSDVEQHPNRTTRAHILGGASKIVSGEELYQLFGIRRFRTKKMLLAAFSLDLPEAARDEAGRYSTLTYPSMEELRIRVYVLEGYHVFYNDSRLNLRNRRTIKVLTDKSPQDLRRDLDPNFSGVTNSATRGPSKSKYVDGRWSAQFMDEVSRIAEKLQFSSLSGNEPEDVSTGLVAGYRKVLSPKSSAVSLVDSAELLMKELTKDCEQRRVQIPITSDVPIRSIQWGFETQELFLSIQKYDVQGMQQIFVPRDASEHGPCVLKWTQFSSEMGVLARLQPNYFRIRLRDRAGARLSVSTLHQQIIYVFTKFLNVQLGVLDSNIVFPGLPESIDGSLKILDAELEYQAAIAQVQPILNPLLIQFVELSKLAFLGERRWCNRYLDDVVAEEAARSFSDHFSDLFFKPLARNYERKIQLTVRPGASSSTASEDASHPGGTIEVHVSHRPLPIRAMLMGYRYQGRGNFQFVQSDNANLNADFRAALMDQLVRVPVQLASLDDPTSAASYKADLLRQLRARAPIAFTGGLAGNHHILQ